MKKCKCTTPKPIGIWCVDGRKSKSWAECVCGGMYETTLLKLTKAMNPKNQCGFGCEVLGCTCGAIHAEKTMQRIEEKGVSEQLVKRDLNELNKNSSALAELKSLFMPNYVCAVCYAPVTVKFDHTECLSDCLKKKVVMGIPATEENSSDKPELEEAREVLGFLWFSPGRDEEGCDPRKCRIETARTCQILKLLRARDLVSREEERERIEMIVMRYFNFNPEDGTALEQFRDLPRHERSKNLENLLDTILLALYPTQK